MRRCPHCQAPNPESAPACHACGQLLAPIAAEPWLRWGELWQPRLLLRSLLPLLLLLLFRISFGRLLTVGMERVELRFLTFHLLSGLLLGAGVAWVRGAREPRAWGLWIAAGLAGGLLAEALEVWFTYRQIMGTITFYLWMWFGLPDTPALIYRILQGLRALGLALPLVLVALQGEKRLSRGLFVLLCLAAAVILRMPLRGIFLGWSYLVQGPQWASLAFYLGSMLPLLYACSLRPLTRPVQNT